MQDESYLHITVEGAGTHEGRHFRRREVAFWSEVIPAVVMTDGASKPCGDNGDANAGAMPTSAFATIALAVVALVVL